MTIRSLARLGTLASLALGLITVSFAQDKSGDDVAQLKAQLAAQQKQIEELTRRLDAIAKPAEEGNAAARRPLDPATRPLVASTTPIFPTTPAPTPITIAPSQTSNSDTSSPLQFKLGDAYFTPVGFMDMTSVTRSTNPGTGIGTNFGSIPYSNVQTGSFGGEPSEHTELAHRHARGHQLQRCERDGILGI